MTDPWELDSDQRAELRRCLDAVAREIRRSGPAKSEMTEAICRVVLACHEAGRYEAGMVFAGASTIMRREGAGRLLAAIGVIMADLDEESRGNPFSPN